MIKGIKFISPTFDSSGYGRASRGNILALYKMGVPITLSPISFESMRPDLGEEGKILESLVNKPIDYDTVFIQSTPEFWAQHVEKGKRNIGMTIWETTRLHHSWPGYINNSVDKCIVGCEWNRNIFKDSGVTVPLGVAPHYVPFPMSKDKLIIPGLSDSTYVFYFIGQHTDRKNVVDLVRCYWAAFPNDEDVALVIKTYRSNYSEEEKVAIKNTYKNIKSTSPTLKYPKTFLLLNMMSEDEIEALHNRGDCYLTLDRGEGFGLSSATAGAHGNPLISTGFGGVNEYANKENSYLVNYSLTPVAGMCWSPWYDLNQGWANPDAYDAIHKLQHVFQNQNEAKQKGLL